MLIAMQKILENTIIIVKKGGGQKVFLVHIMQFHILIDILDFKLGKS